MTFFMSGFSCLDQSMRTPLPLASTLWPIRVGLRSARNTIYTAMMQASTMPGRMPAMNSLPMDSSACMP